MSRVALFASLFAVACAGCPAPAATSTCNTDGDCVRSERCVLGECVVDTGEGEGGAGEEGEGDEGEGEGSSEGEGEGASEGEGEGAREGEGASAGEGEGGGAEGEGGGEGEGSAGEGEGTAGEGEGTAGEGEGEGATTACYTAPDAAPIAREVAFGNSCDVVFSAAKKWTAALRDCRQRGGNLAHVQDETQSTALAGALGLAGVWIGLDDLVDEGVFVWTDASPLTFDAFGAGQPDNSGNEDCVELRVSDWNDLGCDNTRGYVCEIPIVPSHCGDFVTDADEGCDDGNHEAGDGCDASCHVESSFQCIGPFCGVNLVNVPATSLDQAIQDAGPGDLIVVAPGNYILSGDVTKSVTIVAPSGGVNVTRNAQPPLRVKNSVTIRLWQVAAASNSDAVIQSDTTAKVIAVDCTFGPSGQSAVVAHGAATLVRSTVVGAINEGVQLDGANNAVIDSVIVDNGGLGVVFAGPPGAADVFAHNTVVGNGAGGISCAANQHIEGSIIFGNANQDVIGACVVSESDADVPSGFGNISVDPQFVAPSGGDLRLQPGSPCIDAAPLSSEPRDADRSLRTGVRDMGAYEH